MVEIQEVEQSDGGATGGGAGSGWNYRRWSGLPVELK